MDSPAADLLRRARDLVLRGWCQHVDARSADGGEVEPWDASAVAWSLLGSLVAALEEGADHGRELPLAHLASALDRLANFVDDDSLAGWNDDETRTKRDVVAALDAAAIAAAGGNRGNGSSN